MLRAVIIDDESESRTAIANILKNYCSNVDVVGEGNDVASGVDVIKKEKPDVVYLDIQMPDGTGFNLLERIEDIDFHVIFVTAYDQYAIKAIKFSAIDYILKPIDPQQLIDSVEKLKNISPRKNQLPDRLNNLLQNRSKPARIALPTLSGYRFVKIEDIIRCQSESNYTKFFLQSGEEILVTRTLKEFEIMLRDDRFVRVHQSHLINVDFVEQYIKGDGGTAIMSDGSHVEISRRRKDLFLNSLI